MTKIDEPTVLAVIARLKEVECDACFITSVEALLPKPVDRVAELFNRWIGENVLPSFDNYLDAGEHAIRWLLDNLRLIQPRKEWSEEEIEDAAEKETGLNQFYKREREACIRRGIEMGHQLVPVDPVNPAPLTHDEIVKEAREWCAKVDHVWEESYTRGECDDTPSVHTAIAILTAWKGEK